MAYLGGTENEFKGFGAVDDPTDIPDWACKLLPEQCAKSASAALSVIRQKSKDAITELSKQSWYGPVLAETLTGARDPLQMAQEARAMAKGFSADAQKQAIYAFFYGQTRAALEVANETLSKYPQVAAAHRFVGEQERLFIEGTSIFQKYEKTGLDAAGIGDTLSLLRRGVASARGLARAFNVPEGSTADEVMDWTGVVLGCGAAIATGAAGGMGVGAIAGAFACGVTVLSKVFQKLLKAPPPGPDLTGTSWAIFRPQNKEQQGLIANDAVRLASLLKYRYGMPSWNAFTANLTMQAKTPYFIGVNINNTSHPQAFSAATAKKLLVDYGSQGEGKATGFTTRNVLDLLDGLSASTNWWLVAQAVAEEGKLPLYDHFQQDNRGLVYGEIPVVTLFQIAEKAAAPTLPVTYPPGCYSGCNPPTAKDYAGIRIWGELVSFFAAVTKRELELSVQDYLWPWMAGLPITFTWLRDSSIWTRVSPRSKIDILLGFVAQGDRSALIEFANLRLLAAMSYIQMQYRWGMPKATGLKMLQSKKDMIAELPDLASADPASRLRLPVDPRTKNGVLPSPETLHSKIRADHKYLGDIADAARDAAWQQGMKVAQLAGEAKRQILLAEKGAPVASMYKDVPVGVQMLQAGRVELSEKLKCTQSGYTWDPTKNACDFSKPYKPPAPVGVGGLAVVGAAALLGLFLLRR